MGFVEELQLMQVLMLKILSRPHQHTDRRRGLVVSWGVLVQRVCVVDLKQRWDRGGPDVEDPGVRYFTVNLHHHFVLFVPYDGVIYVHGGQHQRHLRTTSFIVVGGWKK